MFVSLREFTANTVDIIPFTLLFLLFRPLFSMFTQLARDQEASLLNQCPDLEDEGLSVTERNDADDSNGICDYRGVDAFVLWDSLEAVAHEDDGMSEHHSFLLRQMYLLYS